MRKTLLLIAPLVLATGAYFIFKNYSQISSQGVTVQEILPIQKSGTEEGAEHKQEAQKERFEREVLMTKDPALGFIPTERLLQAEKQARMMTGSRVAGISSLTWTERGPGNMGGRTRSVIIDRNDATGNTVLAGSVSGGLWRTTNFKSATPAWTQIASVSANLAVTALAQDPSDFNVMYAGTGEGFSNIDAVRGLGIYKSTNGGLTWTMLSSTTTGGANANDFTYVQKILVYSNGHVYASAISAIYCNSGGILKSTNGGTSWTRVIGNFAGGTCNDAFDFAGYDIEMSMSGDLYASVIDEGNSFVAPATFDTTYGKVFRSPAGATVGNVGTWVNVTPPTPVAAGSYWSRIELACSPTNNNKVYAIMQGTGSGVGGIRVTTDAGATWSNVDNTSSWCDQGDVSSTDFSRGQAWYDLCIAIKPDDDQAVFVGGVDLMKTTNGGALWTQATQWAGGCGMPTIHADNHNIIYFPGSATEFIVVNDGGIYYTADNGASYSYKAAGYNTIQYYYGALHPIAGMNYMLAGAQDNGTHKFSSAGLGSVTTATGGDGGFCFIDQDDPTVQITAYTNSYFNVSRDGGANFNVSAHFGGQGRFINPADYDNTSNFLFSGFNPGQVLRVNNITSGVISGNTFSVAAAGSRQVSALKVDPNTANKLWVAFSGGVPQLYYLTNANATPSTTAVTLPAGIGNGHYISNIDVENGNANHILLSVSNYGVASVYESTDGGSTWTSLDNNGVNLPDMPVRWVMFAPSGVAGGILLATELGVWTTSLASGTSTVWTQSAGIPNVRVDMLDFRASDKTILAATHGRGLFTTTESTLPIALLEFEGKLDKNVILLNWTTTTEINSKNFDVEKSTDGVNYYKIGSVQAAGNSSVSQQYNYRDNRVSAVNYYRLQMNDLDGKNKQSNVVLIRNTSSKQNVWIVNNPFNTFIDLRFGTQAKAVKLQLVTINGAVVSEKTFVGVDALVRWNVPSHLSKGSYVIRSIVDGEIFTNKLVKQ